MGRGRRRVRIMYIRCLINFILKIIESHKRHVTVWCIASIVGCTWRGGTIDMWIGRVGRLMADVRDSIDGFTIILVSMYQGWFVDIIVWSNR